MDRYNLPRFLGLKICEKFIKEQKSDGVKHLQVGNCDFSQTITYDIAFQCNVAYWVESDMYVVSMFI